MTDKILVTKVKALGDMELEVLGIPYFGPENGKDRDGEYFSPETKLHEDKFPLPPAVYYHGYGDDGEPMGSPEYIGKTVSFEDRPDGRWYRVILNKTSAFARRVWEAAKEKLARASSGSAAHLARVDRDGHIREWPVVELSIFDIDGSRQPANNYAVALPVMKAVYEQAGMSLPDGLEVDKPEDILEEDAAQETETPIVKPIRGVKMSEKTHTQADVEREKAIAAEDAEKALLAKQEAEKKVAEEKQAEIDAAVEKREEEIKAEHKAELEKKEEEAKKARRLPDSLDAPNVAKYAHTWKYDNLDPGEHALMVGILEANGKPASEDAMKALAIKCVEDKDEDGVLIRTKMAMKKAGMAMKSNELNQSDLASYGDEWVGITYSTSLWEKIRLGVQVLAKIPTVEVPQGSESVIIPLQSTSPTFYKVAQASAQAANPGAITRTVTTSKLGTANQTLSVDKLGAATYFTGEVVEDSLIPWVAELQGDLVAEGQEVLEHIVIDGDTETGASTNINDIAGTPAGTEAFMLFNGFRKLALVTNTANSRGAGAFDVKDFLETLKLMGLAGKNAIQKDKVSFIMDLWTMWQSLELSEVQTRDVFVAPTIEKGELTGIYGYEVLASANMHRANTDTTYGLKANTDGKVDLDTAANNTTGSLMAVRWDQWRFGFKRRMTLESTRVPSADSTEIVALMRVGLINRDDEASAISYNLTV